MLRFVKDVPATRSRISEYRRVVRTGGVHRRARQDDDDELSAGSASGSMPAIDPYAALKLAGKAGKREKAMEDLSRISMLVNPVTAYGLPSLKYLLHLRGVFPNWKCRGKATSTFRRRSP